MDESSLVSVIIPTYNRAYCVGDTIDSALRQTHPAMEVVVVDDGSTDDTAAMMARRFGADARVRYHRQENAGVSAARNTGMGLARGAFFAFLDSDDYWKPWKIELQLACLARTPEAGMIWSDMEAFDDTGRVTDPVYLRTMYHSWARYKLETLFSRAMPLAEVARDSGNAALSARVAAGDIPGTAVYHVGNIYTQMIMGSLVHTSTVLLRRERAALVKAFNTTFLYCGEDYDFHLRTCRAGPVGFIDLPTTGYRLGNADKLMRPAYRKYAAMHTLLTVAPLIESGEKIDLPAMTLRKRMAGLHEWVADTLMQGQDWPGCRRHAALALKYVPWRTRPWKLLLASCLPDTLLNRRRRRQQGAA